MDHISTLLPKTLRKHGLKEEVDASLVVNVANMFLKEHNLRKEAVATKFERNALFIKTSSSAISQECQAISNDLIEQITHEFPSATIESVRIVRQ